MKFNEHPGQIYDAIFYGIIYFNKPFVIKKFKEYKYNLDEAFTFFDEVKNICKPLPLCLYPFFYVDAINPSVLATYMQKNFDFHVHTMIDFLDLIQNRAKLKKHIFDHLFSTLTEHDRNKLLKRDSGIVIDIFQKQAWSSEIREQIILLLYNFSYITDLLYDYLKEIYRHVVTLHKKYKNIIQKRIKESKEKDTLIMLEKTYLLSEQMLKKQSISICLIHQFIYWNIQIGHEESIFIFGNKFKESLITVCNDQPISIDKMLYILGDPLRFNVIRLLQEHGVLTLSDISRLANISTSTAFNILNILYDGNIIRQSHKEGQKIYLCLNIDCLSSSIDTYTEFISNLIAIKENV